MKNLVLCAAALYGMLSVVFGAFGAHALKNVLTPERLDSFETAVRYQMFHALMLLVLGFFLSFETFLQKGMAWCIILGVFLFSGSIYLLSLQGLWNVNLKFLGPITPLGGLLLIVGWALLFVVAFKQ